MKNSNTLKILAVSIAAALLSACAVGPDYVRPQPPQVDAFIRQDPAVATSATAQADPAFWRAFGDPLLERLVDTALANNQDLHIAMANYEQANALLRGSRYDRLPTITADAEAGDARDSVDQAPGVDRSGRDHNQYQASIGFTWELDLFGRVRRSVEAQRAEAAASAEDLAAMQVVVVSQLARTYFQLRGWQEQLGIAQQNADNQARTLQLLEVRLKAGMATPFDVDRGRTQLESTRARIPPLEADVAVATHRIAVLTGRPPQALVAELEAPSTLPALPQNIAVDAPGELLRRRPDVAAAERRLAAATARIGVVTADLFPRFTLGGLIGTQAFDAGALFERDSEMRLLTLGVDGSFLNVGRVRARIAAANAAEAGNLATYVRTVLTALEETENALVQVSRSARQTAHLEEAAAAGTRAAGMAKLRFDQGSIDVLELLDAENARLQSEDAFAQGRLRNTLAVISLYQALAGGWPNQLPAQSVASK
ncbi:RND efflux system, outer membrane lipoprotein CmeC [plant metagenome]|uniref:RND efflux system, outer membrane lipoprotein CmeC n=1 Tax=plant metagenome TaxID=1297885 RepID=A0A484R7H5_9ZZZZ